MKINLSKQQSKQKELADKLRHEMKMRELAHDREGIELHIGTLRAIRRNGKLMDLLMNGFIKTKKLTKSFFNKPVNLSKNVF